MMAPEEVAKRLKSGEVVLQILGGVRHAVVDKVPDGIERTNGWKGVIKSTDFYTMWGGNYWVTAVHFFDGRNILLMGRINILKVGVVNEIIVYKGGRDGSRFRYEELYYVIKN